LKFASNSDAPVVQLDRMLDSGSKGCRFWRRLQKEKSRWI